MHLVAVGGLLNLKNWLTGPVMGVVFIAAGVVIISKAHRRDIGGAISSAAVVLIGIFVAAIGLTGQWQAIGTWISNTVFG